MYGTSTAAFRFHTRRIIIIIIVIITFTITYLLHGALLEKLTGFQLVTKFLTFYRTRMLITVFTSARRLSLS